MEFSLTQVLYDWMHERRIVSAVAREMNVQVSTLSGELRPTNHSAKLGVDSLIPMCRAIRKLGYGNELDGILHQFIHALDRTDEELPENKSLVPQVLELNKSLGLLAECADRILEITDEKELVRLETMVTTQIFPTVMQMANVIANQLTKIRSKHHLGFNQA